MKCSEITLREAIEYVGKFCPIKIVYNNHVLYNDYDSNVVRERTEDGDPICGEIMPPEYVVPYRIRPIDKYIITDINIEIVQHHHSIVTMQGYFEEGLLND